jgi:hypothetical protein
MIAIVPAIMIRLHAGLLFLLMIPSMCSQTIGAIYGG